MDYAREVRLVFGKKKRQAPERLTTPAAAAAFVRSIIPTGETREHFVSIGLDVRGKPFAWQVVSIGTLDSALVHPRSVFGPMVAAAAHSLIVAHNHPSGDPIPSAEDVLVTDRLVAAGQILGVPILDHLVIGDGDSFVSILSKGPRA